jgi:hypothetical protein
MVASPSVASPPSRSPATGSPAGGGGRESPAQFPVDHHDVEKRLDDFAPLQPSVEGVLRSSETTAKRLPADALRAAHPTLFDTSKLSAAGWWRVRWHSTTSVGRVAIIGFLAALIATCLLAAAWIVRDQLYDGARAAAIGADVVVQDFVNLHVAVRLEHQAAIAVAKAVWAAADAGQIALVAPPSVTAVPSAAALVVALREATARTDGAIRSALNNLLDRPALAASLFEDETKTAQTLADRQTANPFLSNSMRFHVGSRATRNPALTQDAERSTYFVSTGFTRLQRRRNLDSYPAWPPRDLDDVEISPVAIPTYTIEDHRARIVPTLALLPEDVAEAYVHFELRVLQLATRTATLSSQSQVAPLVRAAVAASVASIVADTVEAAEDITSPAFRAASSDAQYLERAVDFAGAFEATDTLFLQVLPALLDGPSLRQAWLTCGRVTENSALRGLHDRVVEELLGGAEAAAAHTAPFVDLAGESLSESVLVVLCLHYGLPDARVAAVDRFLPITVSSLILSCLFALIALLQQTHYTRNVIRTARDAVMERTIQYVADVSDAICRFDLEAASALVEAQATEATTSPGLATIHNRLLRCVACLRYVAPALPPLLFPERADSAARYYAVVRRSTPSGSGVNLMAEARQHGAGNTRIGRKGKGKSSSSNGASADGDARNTKAAEPNSSMDTHHPRNDYRLLSREGVQKETLVEGIAERVQDDVDRRFAAFLFVDLSSLLEFHKNPDAVDIAREYVPLMANVVEEAVTLHGGVFHSIQGHTMSGSWGVSRDAAVPDECEAAARAAYVLAARLSIMRRDHAALHQRFQVSIAITAGKVRYGLFEQDASFSLAHVAGPPLARAPAVLRTNYHHQTQIAIDDTTAERLATRQLPSKPIELLATALTDVVKDGESGGPVGGSPVGTAAKARTEARSRSIVGTQAAGTATETEGRAHELITMARHRDPDLPARLAEYKAAFALYQRGYHAEALKAFRKYTKLYGYDGSVERIQSLIVV